MQFKPPALSTCYNSPSGLSSGSQPRTNNHFEFQRGCFGVHSKTVLLKALLEKKKIVK